MHKDPTFGIDNSMLISQKVLDTETDGYALVPAGPLPSGWRACRSRRGAKVFSKGVPWIWPDNWGCTFVTPGAAIRVVNFGAPMMQFDVSKATCDLHLFDTPLSYACPIGSKVGFQVNYNYLQADQPATFSFANLGYNWSFNYLSYLTLDASSTATVRLSEGGTLETFALSGGVYKRDKLSQALLVNMGSGVYQRQLPDGSIMQYDLADGSTPAKTFMTKIFRSAGKSNSDSI